MNNNAWVGVDLDGTIAKYYTWEGEEHIGEPIPRMIEIVKNIMQQGIEVRIFTARAQSPTSIPHIEKWCEEHLGEKLMVTNTKDMNMIFYIDDRAKQVIPNEGIFVEELIKDKL